jgi:hypothetical protein
MGKPENDLTAPTVEYLNRNGFEWHWRNQVLKGRFKGYWINQGKKGIGDYIVIFPDGMTCFIEFKIPGRERTEDQIKFADFCIQNNTPYIYAKSIMDVPNYFKKYFKGTKWEKRFFYYT